MANGEQQDRAWDLIVSDLTRIQTTLAAIQSSSASGMASVSQIVAQIENLSKQLEAAQRDIDRIRQELDSFTKDYQKTVMPMERSFRNTSKVVWALVIAGSLFVITSLWEVFTWYLKQQ